MKGRVLIEDYKGQLLVAHPKNPDDNLRYGIILMISYAEPLSIGIQINKPIYHVKLENICQNMDIWYQGDDLLYYGGLVGTGKVHVIHTSDWRGPSTVQITNHISVTSDISVLTALANDHGPERYRACAGYWTWTKDLLDNQLGLNKQARTEYKWETVPATVSNVFNYDSDDQWNHCLQQSTDLQVKYWF